MAAFLSLVVAGRGQAGEIESESESSSRAIQAGDIEQAESYQKSLPEYLGLPPEQMTIKPGPGVTTVHIRGVTTLSEQRRIGIALAKLNSENPLTGHLKWRFVSALTERQLQLISVIQLPLFLLAIGYPMYRLYVTGEFSKFFGIMYFLLVLWGYAFCMVVPASLTHFFHDDRIYEYFPEGPGAIAMSFTAWMPCLVSCHVARWARSAWRRDKESEANPSAHGVAGG